MLRNLKFNYCKNADSIMTGYARGMVPTINAEVFILIKNKTKYTACYFKTVLFIKPFMKGYTLNNSECYTAPASVTDHVKTPPKIYICAETGPSFKTVVHTSYQNWSYRSIRTDSEARRDKRYQNV